jgi:hypothetical protein
LGDGVAPSAQVVVAGSSMADAWLVVLRLLAAVLCLGLVIFAQKMLFKS